VSSAKQTPPLSIEQACGRVIASAREARGLSQMDLAVSSGYSLRYIGDVERGSKSATLRTLNDLATLLNIQLGSLITQAEGILARPKKLTETPRGNRVRPKAERARRPAKD